MGDNTRHGDGYGIKSIANTKAAKGWVTAHTLEYFSRRYHTVDPDLK